MVIRRSPLSSTTSGGIAPAARTSASATTANTNTSASARFSRSLEFPIPEMHQHLPLTTIASVLMSSTASPPLSPATAAGAAAVASPQPYGRAIAANEAHRCRYKTGKCLNARSNKRNGQPHQLCLYHRDKANQIQRKFDRQKRQVLREQKNSGSSAPGSDASDLGAQSAVRSHAASSMRHRSHLQLHYIHHQHRSPIGSNSSSSVHNITNFAPRFTSLAAKDVDLYSDSDASSRFSTDSSSSDTSAASSLWADLPSPVSAAAFMGLRLTPLAVPSPTPVLTALPSSASSTPGVLALGVTPTATDATPTQSHLSHDEIDFLCSAMLE